MTAFNPFQIFNIMTPNMIFRGFIYPYRTAARVVRSAQPKKKGFAFLQAFLEELWSDPTPEHPPLSAYNLPGNVTQVQSTDQKSVTLITENGVIRLIPLASDLIQIRVRPDGDFPEPFSYGVEKHDWQSVDFNVSESDEAVTLSTEVLTLVIGKSPFSLTLKDKEGRILMQDTNSIAHHPGDNWKRWQVQFDEGTAFYGLGEKASRLNHAGGHFELWNRDPSAYDRGEDPIYMSIPLLLALSDGSGIGLFFDNPHRAWIDLGTTQPGLMDYQIADGEFRLYLMAGTPKSIIERYTELTGRSKLPPLWTFGFHQSRWSYYPQSRVLEIANEFRQRKLPCDVIHLDIHYMDDYRCFTWDKERFPDLEGMLDQLHVQGFKGLSMIDPGIKVDRGYHIYDQGVKADHFIKFPDGSRFAGPVWPGDCHFPDFTRPATRDWWGDQYQGLLDAGMDAFWNDMNEIALITLKTGTFVPNIVEHDLEGQGGQHAAVHNVYGMQMVRASRDGLKRLRPDRRPLLLTRSGWAGVQRYAMHWTGDNQSTWDHLHLSIQMVLNLGLSGVPITGPDLGGFTGGPSPDLFARWMQVGAFTPFYRAHSMAGSPDQEPWALGEEVEAISRKYLELRYRLLPYLYTAAWQAAQYGWPIMRSLSFVYPDDPETYSLDDQYLFGDAFLVAPVLEEGGRQREVYLPAGTWYDFWTGETQNSSCSHRSAINAPLNLLPLFVKGGAIIPLWPRQQYVGEKIIDTLTLYAYPAPGEHHSDLYEDDGLTPHYEDESAHRLSRLILKMTGQETISISRQTVSGQYETPAERIELHVMRITDQPKQVTASGTTIQDQRYDAERGQLVLTLEDAYDFEIHIDL